MVDVVHRRLIGSQAVQQGCEGRRVSHVAGDYVDAAANQPQLTGQGVGSRCERTTPAHQYQVSGAAPSQTSGQVRSYAPGAACHQNGTLVRRYVNPTGHRDRHQSAHPQQLPSDGELIFVGAVGEGTGEGLRRGGPI